MVSAGEVAGQSIASSARLNLAEWYHGLLSREDIKLLLVKQGHFLVRQTEIKKGEGLKMVLSVRWNGKYLHFIINEIDGKAFIGKYQFDSISDLIRHYTITKEPITAETGARLLLAVPRQDWELRHDQVTLGKVIGEGAFGVVYVGSMVVDSYKFQVAVKVLKTRALKKETIKEICKEARIMRRYEHPNIVRFYGVAVAKAPVMLIMEMVEGGSLDMYLVTKGLKLSAANKVNMCLGAAMGLEYLHENGCIHRDIAARNCLVDGTSVKIGDFGLSHETSRHNAECTLGNLKQKLPIRWLAPEILMSASYTTKSDVFSYGILLWEIFMDAAEPYPGMTIAEVSNQVKSGYRMPPPDCMPETIQIIMRDRCLAGDPSQRWTMAQVRRELHSCYLHMIHRRRQSPRHIL